MKFLHILVPVDFSTGTSEALEAAHEIAKKFSSRITLLNVLEHVYHGTGAIARQSENYRRSSHDAAEKQLRSLAASITSGVQVEVATDEGDPWNCIAKQAEKRHADLIIMPTHGRSGLTHLWLGSVAERVVQHSKCPVLVVRPAVVAAPAELLPETTAEASVQSSMAV